MLRSLGLNPNFDSKTNCNTISNLLSKLVNLHCNNNCTMSFTYVGNDKPGIVIPIPQSKDYKNFSKNEKKHNWIEQILQFVMNKNTLPLKEKMLQCGCYSICTFAAQISL